MLVAMQYAPAGLHLLFAFIVPIEWAMHWGQEVVGPLFHMKPEYKLDLDIAVCKVTENKIGDSYLSMSVSTT